LNFFVSLQILDHFVASGLSIFNCNWYDIYDFTPDENTDAVHISLLKTTDSIDNHILTPQKALEHEVENNKLENGDDDSMSLLQPLMSIPLSFSTDNSVVPFTIGNKLSNITLSQSTNQIIEKQFNKSALITIFPHESAIQSAKIICDYLRKTNFVSA
uniref:CHAT domain-containing protein n=1 Tax=Schistosoma curassoni TaxID=6186 RepID=A0A183KT95_9TREM